MGFMTAATSFSVIYMASAAPVPLFAIYRQTLGLTHSHLCWAAVAYFAGAVIALLMFAKISDYLGRRIVIFANLLLTILGCLIFLDLAGLPMLLAGRFIQGFAWRQAQLPHMWWIMRRCHPHGLALWLRARRRCSALPEVLWHPAHCGNTVPVHFR